MTDESEVVAVSDPGAKSVTYTVVRRGPRRFSGRIGPFANACGGPFRPVLGGRTQCHRSKRRVTVIECLTLVAACIVPCSAQISPPRMAEAPSIHGDMVLFSAEGDLWLGSIERRAARRLTSDEGTETNPHFSPDGKLIAFTAGYGGGRDVYVMPTAGGQPRRVTYDPAGADCEGWTPDGRSILFRSARTGYMFPRMYRVSPEGGPPQALPMEHAAQISFAADGDRFAWCPLPMEEHHWKRYHGGEANQVWVGRLSTKRFFRIDDDPVNAQYPVWVGGSVYYVSERDGTANLWRYDVDTKRSERITSHLNYDVESPSSDGANIIYSCGGNLWVYNLRARTDRELSLTVASDQIHALPHYVPGKVDAYSIGPTGKRVAVIARGQLWTLPAEHGDRRAIDVAPGARAEDPAWSPDGRLIAYISDRSGEQNLWLAPGDGSSAPHQLSHINKVRAGGLLWSPDSKWLAYTDTTQRLWLVDASSGSQREVAVAGYGAPGPYRFSRDSAWLAYAFPDTMQTSSIRLYSIPSRSTTDVTSGGTQDTEPTWDPEGKYLYFLSNRSVHATGDAFDFQTDFRKATVICAVSLAAETSPPTPLKDDEEPTGGMAAAAPAKPAPPAPDAPVRIDTTGLQNRVVITGAAAGNLAQLNALPGKVLYVAASGSGPGALTSYDFSTQKATALAAGVQSYQISGNGKMMAVRSAAGIQIAAADAAVAAGKGAVTTAGWQIEVHPRAEWRQIFLEAWRDHRDAFYDPKMHGMDWNAVRDKYLKLLPEVGCRAELTEIIGQMQGELNVSHEFSGGGDSWPAAPPRPSIGSLGAEFQWQAGPGGQAFRITHIYQGDGFDPASASPLTTPGLNVSAGDYLLAINGRRLRGRSDLNRRLVGLGGQVAALAVNTKPTLAGSRTVRVRVMTGDSGARYVDWVQRNRAYVVAHGGGSLGYIHLPDMESAGMEEFTKYFDANLGKDGIIIDVRDNNGGIDSGQVLQRLQRAVFEYDQPRYGLPEPYIYGSFPGRLVVLCNYRTASDGEYFCAGFRYFKLGATVGTRTWGGFMAVGSFQMVDGGYVSTPQAGSFAPDLKWLPDGTGFTPDYVVPEDPNAYVQGDDPQLDKAITVLKAEIARKPIVRPGRQVTPGLVKAFKPDRK